MKRHHLATVFLIICGGLLAYIKFRHGDTDEAIRTGIIFILLGVIMFFLGRLQPRLRSLGVTLMFLTVLGISTYRDFIGGDTVGVILQSVLMILIVLSMLFQDPPSVKDKIEPWLKPTSRIVLIPSLVAVIALLFLLFLVR